MATTASATTPATAATATTLSSTGTGTVGGKTDIDNAVVAKIAGIAAREVPGVFALGGGAARAIGAIRGLANNTDLSQGISVQVGETQVAADVVIVAEYPTDLQAVADGVRTAVAGAIEDYVGLQVTEVNVKVTDVHIPTADDEQQA
ncbi:Asp23/Gls24 family envelope stress response protein [Curtobacterium sp. MCBD17_034]|uniref:Asp23/Gls24 family envelope stress response protein n=1 Tax=unclassified Curtobacterium TaxID=257496 RepID=UPI000DAA0813|nr:MULTISPECIES: Asp23/Gls24 family envelope stress response protein [unclassified Curtobacterium]PZF60247.1 Asp23/Gls24 family envelope stress response protein [Curtobacterium sp. MCBD17_034]PZF61846.1 Asp23/Gls24 family envelope stress response protein [Curtobacterium sp. MCBD17_013]PZM34932.1 Asp23/Gls24 family envelope stress response protein [Curtobacterium sp. MCBD17_031]WIB63307.1 Asp23/Gls24 family envelope stress response protein [Curtobacterium sp. MCBD17_040]WIB67145.1 Asp23/Gls24 f